MDVSSLLLAVAGIVTALNLGPILVKRYRTPKDIAEETSITINTDSLQVSTAKEVVALVRAEFAGKVKENTELQTKLDEVTRRVDLLEERERHMLVRSAVHESWDQLAQARLSQLDPTFPDPPPLTHQVPLNEIKGDTHG